MLDRLARFLEISTTLTVIIVALGVVQLAAQIYALVDLIRRDHVRWGKKWVWALVVALGNLPGAVAYLAAGRVVSADGADTATSRAATTDPEATRRALDTLYTPRDRR